MSTTLRRTDTFLIVVDVQHKLLPVISGGESIVRNIERLVRGCHLLGVPALLTEQYVRGLGPTVEPLRVAFQETYGYAPVEKACFSALRCEDAASRVLESGRRQIVVAGVETHVCVHQTIADLLDKGADVTIVADATGSRTERNRDIALARFATDGVHLSSTEMVLFELLGTSGTDEFRAISRLIR